MANPKAEERREQRGAESVPAPVEERVADKRDRRDTRDQAISGEGPGAAARLSTQERLETIKERRVPFLNNARDTARQMVQQLGEHAMSQQADGSFVMNWPAAREIASRDTTPTTRPAITAVRMLLMAKMLGPPEQGA